MENNTIGIIVPVYNSIEYLDQCFNSIKEQTVPFDKVVIINDGSTDGSAILCQKFCAINEKCVFVSQNNAGLSSARNLGIKLCDTDYIVFLDSDDYIKSQYCETLHSNINNQDILYFSADIYDETGEAKDRNYYIRTINDGGHQLKGIEFLKQTFARNHIVSSCLAMYRRKFLLDNNILFPVGLFHEDNLFFIQSVLSAQKVSCIVDHLYIRRYRFGSIMTTRNLRKLSDRILIERKIWDYISKHSENWLFLVTLKNVLDIYIEAQNMSYDHEKVFLDFIADYFNEWIDDRKVRDLSLYNLSIIYLMYQLLINNERNILLTREYSIPYIYKRKRTETLEKTRLNQTERIIAIYGMGNHTKALFMLYEKYVGKITNPFVYISSYKEHSKESDGHLIYEIKDFSKTIDKIIVSSLEYQKEMTMVAKQYGITDDKFILFYTNQDIVDLVFIAEMVEPIVGVGIASS